MGGQILARIAPRFVVPNQKLDLSLDRLNLECYFVYIFNIELLSGSDESQYVEDSEYSISTDYSPCENRKHMFFDSAKCYHIENT